MNRNQRLRRKETHPTGGLQGSLCFHQLFEAQVARAPEAVAVHWKGRDITYQELDRSSHRLAQGLVAKGVGPETVVALAARRGPALLEGILGISKAGGAYLPLDPAYPAKRLLYMVEDSGVQLLLAEEAVLEELPELPVELVDFQSCREQAQAVGEDQSPALPSSENLAYVIYTSGSTGRPKGVLVSHGGLANLAEVEAASFGAGIGKKILQFAPASFDASVFEILMALHTGATLVLEEQQNLLPGLEFIELLKRQRITHLLLPPSVLGALPPAHLPDLENLVCAGESLPAHLVTTWGTQRRMFNAYGPTEATVAASMTRCRADGESPSIGAPLQGTRLYVVGSHLELREEGQSGELLISAIGLARGYLGRPSLTAERFIPDPFSNLPGGRLYRSGDAVSWRSDGALDFVGRVDYQIKIHGHRIEPGEIEALLLTHPVVGQCLVLAHQEGSTEELLAYVAPRADLPTSALEEEDLKRYLGERLPGYMVPTAWMILDDMPLTPNGKVARAALPAPERRRGGGTGDESALDPLESTLVRLCQELLAVEDIGLDDDLFSLGGHSLLMGRLVARIRGALGAELTLAEIFATPTVAGLAARLRQGRQRRPLPPIHRIAGDRGSRNGPAPLSFPQERVWFLNELAPGNVAYNSQATMSLNGKLEPRYLQAALTEIVRRHEVFRSRFPAIDGSPVQEVMPPLEIPLPVLDLSRLDEADLGEESERLVRRALREAFDLLQVPLARWVLMRLETHRHVLIQVEHHFVHDGWSFGVLLREMQALYAAYAAGEPSPLRQPPVQGSDFALWQRQWLQGEVLEEYLDYWVGQLEGSTPSLELPTDHPRPKAQSFQGDAVRIELDRNFADDLRGLAKREGVTLFTVMLAGFKALLHRYSGQRDILVGTAAANRRLEEVEHMLGMVVNTLVLRSQVDARQGFSQLLQKVGETSLGAFAYQDMPLDKLIERLDPERDLSRNPLFQVMFSFHDSPVPDLDFAGLTGEVTERHNGSAKADLNIVGIPRAEQRLGGRVNEAKQGITLIWEYSTDLFERTSMERMVTQYQTLLTSAASIAGQMVGGLELLREVEREQLRTWNQTATPFPRDRALHQLFEHQVDRQGAALAVSSGSSEWSYEDLEERANRLARLLVARGVGHRSLVALALDRSPELLLAVLAVTKAGAAYLPLDPHHPVERLSYILEDSGAHLVVTAGSLPQSLVEILPERVDLVADTAEIESCSSRRLEVEVSPSHRAYVIYTSGSTGQPKGSEIPHRGAVNLAHWHIDAFQVGPDDRGTLVASPSFDASVWEIWPYLAAGSSLHIPPQELRAAPRELFAWLAENRISVAFLPTALGEAVLEEVTLEEAEDGEEPDRSFPASLALRTLLLGGDRLRRPPAPGLPFRVINNYGLTEDSVVATSGEVAPVDSREARVPVPSIGTPIANHHTYVLDPLFALVPVGVPGELYIAGDGLAWGYLNRPSLTAERFLPDPYTNPADSSRSDFSSSSNGGGRLYRTGDRVRWLGRGELEYLGRSDHQVQVRGFRVEPGEIESALQESVVVQAAAVVPSADSRQLVGFVVCEGQPEEQLAISEALREELARSLPDYMVPARIVAVDELPLAPTGKVDRRALVRQADQMASDWGPVGSGDEPKSVTEEMIAGIWASLLEVDTVGVRDDFFSLGGHSLLAARVLSRIRESLEVDLPLRALFEWPTVEQLGRAVEEHSRVGSQGGGISSVPREGSLALSFGQERLWFLDRLIPESSAYHICRAYELRGELSPSGLQIALAALAVRHESLRTTFGERGGQAVQMVAEPGIGETVPALPVIDLTGLVPVIAQGEAERLRGEEGRRPFDLSRLPLHRWTLLRTGETTHQLLLTFHHIITDGWSTGVLLRQLAEAYGKSLAGEDLPEPSLSSLDYVDFAAWQRQSLDADSLEELLTYWRSRLEGAPAVLEIPLDRPRPKLQSFQGDQVRRFLAPDRAARLRRLARESGVTWFMALLASLGAVLSRLSGQSDVVIGSPVAGRTRREVDSVVGLFVNTLALHLGFAGKPTFRELLERSRQATLGALAHQALPFERLVAELESERDLSHSPVFQVLLVPGEADMEALSLPGLETQNMPVPRGESQFDLALFARDSDLGLELALRYDSALFDGSTAQRTLGQLVSLLDDAIDHPEKGLQELQLLSASQRHAALSEWNDTARSFPRDQLLHQAFEARAAESPEAVAVVTATRELDYGELNRRANQLAHQLRELGAKPGTLVGVHLGRQPEMIVTVLAVLKVGAAYVPMELSWPAERCRWIISRKGIEILVTRSDRLAEAGSPTRSEARWVVCMDRPGVEVSQWDRVRTLDQVEAQPDTDLPPLASPEDLAYIIFTSGSTGRPKGVMVRHRPVVQLIQWVTKTFGVGPGDHLLYTTALSFDLSVYDIFGTLAAGGSIRLASEEELEDPQQLVDLLAVGKVTFWDSAPAALQRLAPLFPRRAAQSQLRLVFLSGDWIPLALPDQVRDTFTDAQVISLGGATEATVWSNFFPVGEVEPSWSSIPYGRPIDNARYLILDSSLEPCPIRVAGDLYIAGEVLSSGYFQEAQQTALSYLPDPFAASSPLPDQSASRLYRTGDRARFWDDGTMEFLGRQDSQVKVRGYRIELGEIEAVLAEHSAIDVAVVLVREDVPGDQRLVAYFTSTSDRSVETQDLVQLAKKRLPEYMVPHTFVARDSWPLSPTGKLDRSALPAPEPPQRAQSAVRLSPRSFAETTIVRVWKKVIGIEEVGVDDNFFDLGGHSLLMARVHSLLQEQLHGDLSMADLFRFPTVAALAEAIAPAVEVPPEATLGEPEPVAAEPAAEVASGVSGHIAIIGMAGRFAGSANLNEFWQALRAGRELTQTFSDEELTAAGVPASLLENPRYVKTRGALSKADHFDASFFGYSPREAEVIDPQQRLFLETSWEALEDSGYVSPSRGERVGVFGGVSSTGYGASLLGDPEVVGAVGGYQINISNAADYLPTRVSYKLNLTGPSVNVQTACSTSLVAVHLAVKALHHGECELALAGGACALPQETRGYLFEPGGIASPDGRTRAFDASAGGTVGGSGVGAVVLKPLEKAMADGDTIRAVIRGSALTNDGSRKVGFTAPSIDGQAEAIRQAHLAAGVSAESIDYVEAHGTATAMGDPIEVAALHEVFPPRSDGRRCGLGAVKSNVGHLDAAAGIAGLIKTVLALQQEEIPASLHFDQPNPEVDFSAGPFSVERSLRPWPSRWDEAGKEPRRAGVSSFGIGGTNAHLVLEEAPPASPSAPTCETQLLVLSAKTAEALEQQTIQLADYLQTKPETPVESATGELADVAFTLQTGRRPFQHRRAIVCRSTTEALEALRGEAPGRVESRGGWRSGGGTVFLFPGQGAQYAAMGAHLYEEGGVFRKEVDRCLDLVPGPLRHKLQEILLPTALASEVDLPALDARLLSTAMAQPALFIVEYALARQWMAWGAVPEALLGHSLGEWVAACLAGVFQLEEALHLVIARGEWMEEMEPGDMLAVALPEADLLKHLERHPEVELAAVNGELATTVSGPSQGIFELADSLARAGVEFRPLHTSHAFHSASMEPMLDRFAAEVEKVERRAPSIAFLSNVTGTWITEEQARDSRYWTEHLRRTVRFHDGLSAVLARQGMRLLEVGPGRQLSTFARQHQQRDQADLIETTLPHPKNRERDLELSRRALGNYWLAGGAVDWDAFHGPGRRRVSLPTYPFESRRYLLGPAARKEALESAVESVEELRSLKVVSSHPSSVDTPLSEVETAVADVWNELLGVQGLRPHDDFFDLGGSSLMAIRLGQRLEAKLGAELPMSTLLEASTLGALAQRVVETLERGEAPAPASSSLVALQPGDGRQRPLFLVHQVGGQAFTFRALAKNLGSGRPVFAFRSQGLETGETVLGSIEEMASHYLELLREAQPEGPYALGGASMGGMVAFEMAQQLIRQGEKVDLLAVMDTPCLDQMPVPEDGSVALAAVFQGHAGIELDPTALRAIPDPQDRLSYALEKAAKAAGGKSPLSSGQASRYAAVLEANAAALYRYRPEEIPGRIVLLRAQERRTGDPPRPELAWIRLARGGLDFVLVPGNHLTMHQSPHVEVAATCLRQHLESATGRTPTLAVAL